MNFWRKLLRALFSIFLAAFSFAAVSCSSPHIPDKVAREEMEVYREWLKQHFANKAPEQLYLDDQTFVFDPVRDKLDRNLERNDHISRSLIKQFHALGPFNYPLDIQSGNMNLPWPYQVLDPRKFPNVPVDKLHVIAFSRVAFNDNHSEALFAFSDLCAAAECGRGQAVLATKQGEKWQFKGLSYVWTY